MAKQRKKINWKSKKTWKNALIIGLACITCVGAIVGLSSLFRKSEETTHEISPTYAVGGLTSQGKYLETEESIYSKDAFECYGLKTSLVFDNNISYQLYFYDESNEFVGKTEELTNSYNSENSLMPLNTKYCRRGSSPFREPRRSLLRLPMATEQSPRKVLILSTSKEPRSRYQIPL